MKRVGLVIVIGLLLFPLISSSDIPEHNTKTLFAAVSQPLLDAEDAVENAYKAVLDADNAGANVTQLVQQLNYVLELLDEAWNIYGTNQTYAEQLANQAEVIANGVYEVATDLLVEMRSTGSIWLVLFPLGVVFVIVFVGIAVYYSWQSTVAEEEEELLDMEVSIPEEGDAGGKE
ncbi:MAG: hypothetical protein ACFE7E_01835 [Candidatus Hodarchaeota archaeon]